MENSFRGKCRSHDPFNLTQIPIDVPTYFEISIVTRHEKMKYKINVILALIRMFASGYHVDEQGEGKRKKQVSEKINGGEITFIKIDISLASNPLLQKVLISLHSVLVT